MIVLMIIGFLALIVYGSLSSASGKARDVERKKLLVDLDQAVQLYYEDNGQYPEAGCGAGENWVTPGDAAGSFSPCEEYIVGLVPNYLTELPQDPKSEDERNSGFAYRVIGDEYKVMVYDSVESNTVFDQEDEFSRCDSSCLLHPGNPSNGGTGGWGNRCEDEAFFRTYALYRDSVPGNKDGSECF